VDRDAVDMDLMVANDPPHNRASCRLSMDFRGLDLNLILLLDALIEDPNQTRVAKLLKISQPTVSASLSKLRRILNDDLIVKAGNGYRATPRLTSLRPAIKQVLNILNTEIVGSSEFNPVGEVRQFVIATSDVGEMMMLPSLIAQLKNVAPSATIRSAVVRPPELEEALGEGKVDLAVGYFPDLVQSTIVQQLLFEHPFVCLVRKDHPIIGDSLTIEQFLASDHIVVAHEGRSQEIFEHNLKRLDLKRRSTVQVPHFLSVPFLVASSDLIVTVPRIIGVRFSTFKNIKMLDPPVSTPLIEVKQFWHRRFHANPRSMWFRGVMMDLFRSHPFDE
jgi:DNA-binding transcriptional LysR family regulator